MASMVDLSTDRAREQELQLNKELLTNLVDSVSVVLWAADPDGEITLAVGKSLNAEDRTDSYDEGFCGLAVGASIYGLFDDVARLRQCFVKALSGEQTQFTWQNSAGATFETHIGPRTEPDGSTVGVIGVSLNVTDRVEAQEALKKNLEKQIEMEQQLDRAQRLEAVGRLTGGIAHDFNNLLTTILGNVDLLTEQIEEQPELKRFAESAARAAGRGANLTQRLLAFSRQQTLQPRPTDVSGLANELTEMLRRTVPESIAIETAFDDAPVYALVDPAQLESALLNLALNARDAMVKGGIMRISTTATKVPRLIGNGRKNGKLNGTANGKVNGNGKANGANHQASGYVSVTVTDTGTGMSPEVVEKVFDPFFTTKEAGRADYRGITGSGLGLSMVYGFVKQSKGHVHIDSTPGNGTVVTLLLPAAAAPQEHPVATNAFPGMPKGSEVILVIEDDADVRDFVVNALEHLGYTVITACDGTEALSVAAATPQIDLLISDVVLPGGLTGPAVADRILDQFEDTKLLFTSGYVADNIRLETRRDGHAELLTKPYTVQALAKKVREVLESPVPPPPLPAGTEEAKTVH